MGRSRRGAHVCRGDRHRGLGSGHGHPLEITDEVQGVRCCSGRTDDSVVRNSCHAGNIGAVEGHADLESLESRN